jgi:hypothetical protein
MKGYENFALQALDGADHTFTSLASQGGRRSKRPDGRKDVT